MADYNWSTDDNIAFDPVNDTFNFDDSTISAADVLVQEVGADLTFSHNGKTVTLLNTAIRSLTTTNVTFLTSWLMVGDHDTGTAGDDTPNSLVGTPGGGNDQLIGLGGSDTLEGGAGNDRLDGGDGEDQILYTVGDGIDSIDGGSSTDSLLVSGTSGDDVINVVTDGFVLTGLGGGTSNVTGIEAVTLDLTQGGADTLDYTGTIVPVIVTLDSAATGIGAILGTSLANVTGGAAPDLLTGDGDANIINGGAGDDQINGKGGDDTLNGGDDDDTFNYDIGDGRDTVDGGGPGDFDLQIVGGTAAAHYYYVNPVGGQLGINIEDAAGLPADAGNAEILASNVEEIEIHTGDGGDTVIIAGDLDDVGVASSTVTVVGGSGDDTFDASGLTDDLLVPVDVVLDGAGGNDVLKGGGGDDDLFGGPGDDQLYGNGGLDWYDADTGNDTLYYTVGGSGYIFDGCDDTDTLNVLGTAADDVVFVQTDAAGNIVTVDFGLVIDIEIFNLVFDQGGNDTLSYFGNDPKSPVTVDLSTFLATGFDSVSAGVENVYGGAGDDSLTGDDNANELSGSGGNDVIHGRGGDDVIVGGGGDDQLDGEGGDDVFTYLVGDTSSPLVTLLSVPGVGNDSDNVVGGETDEVHGDTQVVFGRHFQADFIFINPIVHPVDGAQLGFNVSGDLGPADENNSEIRAVQVEHVIVHTGDGNDTVIVSGDLGSVGVDHSSVIVEGGDGNDTFDASGVVGGAGGPAVSVTLKGYGGDDTLLGGEAGDQLYGGESGAVGDFLFGGGGFDFAHYDDALLGVTADLGNPANNTNEALNDHYTSIEGLIGSANVDHLYGDDNGNVLEGLAGDDTLFGNGSGDELYGGEGGDAIDGGAGIDSARYDHPVTVDLSAGLVFGGVVNTGEAVGDTFVSIEGVIGSPGDDQIYGDNGVNYLQGRGGADQLYGGAGGDQLYGGLGPDHLDGGTDFDFARYDAAATGVEVHLGGFGGTGEADGDTFTSIEGLIGSAHDDRLFGNGGSGSVLHGMAGDDQLFGGEAGDELYGDTGADQLNGGIGLDYARYENAVRVDLSNGVTSGVPNTGDALGDTFSSVEGVIGSPGNDEIYGDDNANYLQGRGGNDKLFGGAGGDQLYGGAGADELHGGADFDFARYDTAGPGLIVDLGGGAQAGEALGDTFESVEGVVGSSNSDVIHGDGGNNVLNGGVGNVQDFLFGEGGNDELWGGAGGDALDGGVGVDTARYATAVIADLLDPSHNNTGEAGGDAYISIENLIGSASADFLSGDNNANMLVGGAGIDHILGRGGNDDLRGGDGNGIDDTLDGGAGVDVLTGGTGWDTFEFHIGEADGDTVTDFFHGAGVPGDQLVFHGYGAGATFINIDPTHWQVNSNLFGGVHETITIANGALLTEANGDWLFL